MGKYIIEHVFNEVTGKTVCVSEILQQIDNMIAAGRSESALFDIDALIIVAAENNDEKLKKDLERRKNKYRFPYKYQPYQEEGAADQINQKKEKRKGEVADGKHKGFPFIQGEYDPFRMAQVVDLYSYMTDKVSPKRLIKTDIDIRNFINCFTEGTTTSTIPWLGSIRQLHFIVFEWNHRGHIPFSKDDEVWDIASRIFVNPKDCINGRPTCFGADKLRKAKNPKIIIQELEDIVEFLNPDKPSPNYEKFKESAEDRIKYGQRERENKGAKPGLYDHIFDDEDDV